MKHNVGTLDRLIRTFVAAPALVLVGLVVFQFGSLPSIIAFALAGIMLATSAMGYCPLYAVLGISTCPHRTDARPKTRVAPQA